MFHDHDLTQNCIRSQITNPISVANPKSHIGHKSQIAFSHKSQIACVLDTSLFCKSFSICVSSRSSSWLQQSICLATRKVRVGGLSIIRIRYIISQHLIHPHWPYILSRVLICIFLHNHDDFCQITRCYGCYGHWHSSMVFARQLVFLEWRNCIFLEFNLTNWAFTKLMRYF